MRVGRRPSILTTLATLLLGLSGVGVGLGVRGTLERRRARRVPAGATLRVGVGALPRIRLPPFSTGGYESEAHVDMPPAETVPPGDSPGTVEVRRTIGLLASGHAGTSVKSIDCQVEPCGVVLAASDLRVLRALVLDVNAAYGGHIALDIRDRPNEDGTVTFEAAIVIGTPTIESVASLDTEF